MPSPAPDPGTAPRNAGPVVRRTLGAAALLALGAGAAPPPSTTVAHAGVVRRPARAVAPPDTVVDGFHGYRFGTPGVRIEEIDVTAPPYRRHEGLEVYARDLHFLGVPTRAYFYLDSARRRLRRGKHLIEPDPSSCVRQLTTLRLMVAATHPELDVRIRRSGGGSDTTSPARGGAPPVRCPDFLDADSAGSWTVLFRNPSGGRVEARMELFRRDDEPRILACYLNETDCAWPDSVEVRPGPRMLAPGREPDTAAYRPEPRPDGRSPRRRRHTPNSAGR